MAWTDADTIYHTQKMKGEIEDADRPFAGRCHQARRSASQGLFETSTEVLGGPVTASTHYEQKSEAV
jgi:hypothetical protein